MKRTLKILAVFFIALSLCYAGCARAPKTSTSSKVIQRYFKKYGKKYPDTVYKSGIKTVEVINQTEIHKHLVAVQAFLTMNDGSVERVYATLEKGPAGWRFISWENDTGI